jgi:hypothetical protein
MEKIILPISGNRCPYGGYCIDPGIPSDCGIKGSCFPFTTPQEKLHFDALPDLYEVTTKVDEHIKIIKFKNLNQLRFFLKDTSWSNFKTHVITENGTFEIDTTGIL